MIEERLAGLRSFLRENGADAVLINKEVNLHYFSGFRGDDTLLLVSADKAFLLTDFRYTEQAAEQAAEFEIVEQKHGLWKEAAAVIKKEGWKQIAFEGNAILFNNYSQMEKELRGEAYFATPVSLDSLRVIKDENEIECIRKAVSISDAAFEDIISYIKPGMSEIEVAARMEQKMRELGSERPAFTTIVASGARGSLPHGVATEKLIVSGEFVTMDFGAVYKGYHSDITRTVCVGKADEKQKEIYSLVLNGQLLGESLVKPGASGKQIDAAVRGLFAEKGYEKYFGHGLGHSLGLEIHEEPRLSPSSLCEHLEPNTLVTVEPGIYIPGWGGIRIEDTVLVTAEGSEPLTRSDKKLIEIFN